MVELVEGETARFSRGIDSVFPARLGLASIGGVDGRAFALTMPPAAKRTHSVLDMHRQLQIDESASVLYRLAKTTPVM